MNHIHYGMAKGSSNHVRNAARREYAPSEGSAGTIRIVLGDLQKTLLKEGFPANHLRQIRTSLESDLFWRPLGWRLVSPRGQSDKVSTVLEFVVLAGDSSSAIGAQVSVDPLLELSGILRGAIREGAAAFLQELRRDKGERIEVSGTSDQVEGNRVTAA
jgi:hypothetical protein